MTNQRRKIYRRKSLNKLISHLRDGDLLSPELQRQASTLMTGKSRDQLMAVDLFERFRLPDYPTYTTRTEYVKGALVPLTGKHKDTLIRLLASRDLHLQLGLPVGSWSEPMTRTYRRIIARRKSVNPGQDVEQDRNGKILAYVKSAAGGKHRNATERHLLDAFRHYGLLALAGLNQRGNPIDRCQSNLLAASDVDEIDEIERNAWQWMKAQTLSGGPQPDEVARIREVVTRLEAFFARFPLAAG